MYACFVSDFYLYAILLLDYNAHTQAHANMFTRVCSALHIQKVTYSQVHNATAIPLPTNSNIWWNKKQTNQQQTARTRRFILLCFSLQLKSIGSNGNSALFIGHLCRAICGGAVYYDHIAIYTHNKEDLLNNPCMELCFQVTKRNTVELKWEKILNFTRQMDEMR